MSCSAQSAAAAATPAAVTKSPALVLHAASESSEWSQFHGHWLNGVSSAGGSPAVHVLLPAHMQLQSQVFPGSGPPRQSRVGSLPHERRRIG